MVTAYEAMGQPVGRAEGPEQVTGAAVFAADVNLRGTLGGQCLRSPYPLARIKPIDVPEAQA